MGVLGGRKFCSRRDLFSMPDLLFLWALPKINTEQTGGIRFRYFENLMIYGWGCRDRKSNEAVSKTCRS